MRNRESYESRPEIRMNPSTGKYEEVKKPAQVDAIHEQLVETADINNMPEKSEDKEVKHAADHQPEVQDVAGAVKETIPETKGGAQAYALRQISSALKTAEASANQFLRSEEWSKAVDAKAEGRHLTVLAEEVKDCNDRGCVIQQLGDNNLLN